MRAKFIYEAFSEDGDPVKDLGIGFVEHISKALTNITKDNVVIDFLGSPIIKDFAYTNGELIVYTQFTLPYEAPYIKDVFERYGLSDYINFHTKNTTPRESVFWFNLKIKPKYQKAFEEAVSRIKQRKGN